MERCQALFYETHDGDPRRCVHDHMHPSSHQTAAGHRFWDWGKDPGPSCAEFFDIDPAEIERAHTGK